LLRRYARKTREKTIKEPRAHFSPSTPRGKETKGSFQGKTTFQKKKEPAKKKD